MWVGTVVGTLVATPKDESLTGCKLLIVQPEGFGKNTQKDCVIAVDKIGAGTGEKVLVVTGSSARMVTDKPQGAVDAAIVGIVDTIELNKALLEE